jgi:hypothetical protein
MSDSYADVIRRTEQMVEDKKCQRLAAAQGLEFLNVTWEDTGRYKGSCVGPNISDMTIQVQRQRPRSNEYELTCMPVLRFPNFSDISADIAPEQFFVLNGNEKGRPLQKVHLRQLLGNIRGYLHDPKSWKGDRTSLIAPSRDSHFLVSAQACFLPIPKDGVAEFNPVLFNYQSVEGDPAVLTILATREGTSITVIDNVRDGFAAGDTWGQRLFFNQNGQRCSLTGKRMSEFLAAAPKGPASAARTDDAAGLNLVLLIQVPLKQQIVHRGELMGCYGADDFEMCLCDSDVEEAVIGHGKVEGPFTELAGLAIERDDRFPVRVTVQFYQATSNGVVSEADLARLAAQIGKVYQQADYVGSLVVEGETGRPTEHAGPKLQPPNWWDAFWRRHFANTGQTRVQAIRLLVRLLGPRWYRESLQAAEEALRRGRSR